MATQFEAMRDKIERKYGCIVIYFTTDADGGSNKGQKILEVRRPWLLTLSCWAHQVMFIKLIKERRQILISIQFQLILGDYFKVYDAAQMISELVTDLIGWLNNHGKVWIMFDEAQAEISKKKK
jgi:hypothetical protein